MSSLKRVVFDTSTLISAALRNGSTPDMALTRGFAGCEVCVSTETLTELEEVLGRKKFDRYLGRESRQDFIAALRESALVISSFHRDLGDLPTTCRDSKDNKFLALALEVDAGTIVSSDKDLLVLHPWRGIRIVTPAEFVADC